jgi:hypothetical protein
MNNKLKSFLQCWGILTLAILALFGFAWGLLYVASNFPVWVTGIALALSLGLINAIGIAYIQD